MTIDDIATLIKTSVLEAQNSKRRLMIAVTGPPAAGKSTVAERLVEMFQDSEKAALVPMDGFHLDNATLRKNGTLHRKGAPETFDLVGFTNMIERLSNGEDATVPHFDRSRDCVVPHGAEITSKDRILVFEGNYLLLDQEGWRDLSRYWDSSAYLSVSMDTLKERLIQRWLNENHSYAEAERRVLNNDLPNAAHILSNKMKASLDIETE